MDALLHCSALSGKLQFRCFGFHVALTVMVAVLDWMTEAGHVKDLSTICTDYMFVCMLGASTHQIKHSLRVHLQAKDILAEAGLQLGVQQHLLSGTAQQFVPQTCQSGGWARVWEMPFCCTAGAQ